MPRQEPSTVGLVRNPGRVTFQSAIEPAAVIGSIAADVGLPDVVIPIAAIPGSINRVYAAFSYRKTVESSTLANALAGEQFIQVKRSTSLTFEDAIVLPDNALQHAAGATEGGALIAGDIDVSGEVNGPGTYNLQWELAAVDGDSITIHDVQCFLVVEYV